MCVNMIRRLDGRLRVQPVQLGRLPLCNLCYVHSVASHLSPPSGQVGQEVLGGLEGQVGLGRRLDWLAMEA